MYEYIGSVHIDRSLVELTGCFVYLTFMLCARLTKPRMDKGVFAEVGIGIMGYCMSIITLSATNTSPFVKRGPQCLVPVVL